MGDDAAFVDAIHRIGADPGRCRGMGRAASPATAALRPADVACAFEAILQDLVANRHGDLLRAAA